MRTDSLLYQLFQDWPELALELAELDPAAGGYRWRAVEVKQTAFRLDGVLEPPDDRPDAPLVFVEHQFQYDADFHARWFAELFLYLYRHPPRRPWRALALFPSRAIEQGPDDPARPWQPEPAYAPLLAHPWVRRVHLREALAAAPRPSRALRVLGLLLAAPDEVVAAARALLAETPAGGAPSGPVLANWVETLLIYKLPRLSREEVRTMLETLHVDLKQTRFYREVYTEGWEEGREEGREEGWEEGRLTGHEEGQRQERERIARSLLDLIGDDRLLAERTGLSEAEVRRLRADG